MKLNAIDKLIGYLAPQRGLARARARMAVSVLRDYDAASHSRRTDGWRSSAGSANRETHRALTTLRNRHRELVRNNPWAARAVQAVVSNTVAFGITAELKGTKKIAGAWRQWCETTACDADGRHDVYGLQALVMRAVVEGGEGLVVRRPQPSAVSMAAPVKIQVLEGDYLDHSKTQVLASGNLAIQGVEFDRQYRRVAYWLFPEHPGDVLTTSMTSERVPAEDVAHVFRMDRPGQVRGVPWGAPVMMTLRDLDDFEDAYLLRQKLANCLTGFVYDHTPELGATAATGLPMPETLEPGLIAGLPSGKDIKFNDPPKPDGYGPYTKDVLLRVAAGYGITFQALTGDLSSVNFSSGRMGWLEMHRNIEQWRWHMLIPQMCERIAQWWLDAASLAGMRTDTSEIVWTPPRREMIDPSKETSAAKDAVRSGFKSLQDVHREWGMQPTRVLDEIEEMNKELDRRGIKLDSDPRTGSAAKAPVRIEDEETEA